MNQKPYKKTYTPDQALEKLRKYCAYQERCHQEVKQKLYDLGVYGDTQDEIISELITDNFLNETRFAEGFVRGKYSIKKWGRSKIIQELKRRQISAYNIKKGLLQIEETSYTDNIKNLIEKKLASLKSEKNTFVKRKKTQDYMMRKGYQYHEIADFLPTD